MSIFGDLDITQVSDDPFAIAEATYYCTCTDAKIIEKDGNRILFTQWTIDAPGTEYDNMKIPSRNFLPPADAKSADELDGDQIRSLKFLRKYLREAFDLSESEQQKFTPEELLKKTAWITTVNKPGKESDQKFVNIRTALCDRLYEEQAAKYNENATAAGSSVGL